MMQVGRMMQRPLNVMDLLRHATRNHGSVQIVSRRVEGDIHRYTYQDAYRRICQLARALDAAGVTKGQRVGTLAWNTYRHFELYYATAGLGAVCHTINPRFQPEKIAAICNQAEDQLLFFDHTFLPLILQIAPRLKTVRHFYVLADSGEPSAGPSVIEGYEQVLARQSAEEYSWPILDENSPCGLCFTSGTTGEPKGVAYTHRSTVLHALSTALPDATALSSRDVVLPVVPMFHVNAWGFPYSVPMVGAKLVLPGPNLDGKSLYELCEQEAVTMAAGVPTVWLGLLAHMRKNQLHFSTLKRTLIGGSAISAAMIREFEVDHSVVVTQGWGMTETSPVATVNQLKAQHNSLSLDAKVALKIKQGRELFGVELRVVDEHGAPLAHDGVSSGSLFIRGPWVVDTYEGGVKAARDDGWFDTGDIATIDAEGFMHIVDRAKDVVKSGGEWISSIEIENLAMGHPKAALCAVIGVAHPKWTERPILLVKLKDGESATKEDFLKFLEGKVVKWWLPDDVLFVADIPLGATGKIDKKVIRERLKSYVLPGA